MHHAKPLALMLATMLAMTLAGCGAPRSAAPADVTPTTTAAAVTAAAVDPVGTFDFSTVVDGETIRGEIRIARTATGGYTADVTTPATSSMTGMTTTVAGNRIAIRGADGLQMNLELNAATLAGGWSYNGMTGTLTATRRQQ
ncbi:MAG: hypothetical protein WEF86_16260 [Gemmatimonadota bacterium]